MEIEELHTRSRLFSLKLLALALRPFGNQCQQLKEMCSGEPPRRFAPPLQRRGIWLGKPLIPLRWRGGAKRRGGYFLKLLTLLWKPRANKLASARTTNSPKAVSLWCSLWVYIFATTEPLLCPTTNLLFTKSSHLWKPKKYVENFDEEVAEMINNCTQVHHLHLEMVNFL